MASNEEIYNAIEVAASEKIQDPMRLEVFLINAYNAYRRNDREALIRYLHRVRPPVRGGGYIYHISYYR